MLFFHCYPWPTFKTWTLSRAFIFCIFDLCHWVFFWVWIFFIIWPWCWPLTFIEKLEYTFGYGICSVLQYKAQLGLLFVQFIHSCEKSLPNNENSLLGMHFSNLLNFHFFSRFVLWTVLARSAWTAWRITLRSASEKNTSAICAARTVAYRTWKTSTQPPTTSPSLQCWLVNTLL